MAKPPPVYQNPLVCHGHSRPIVELQYSAGTEDGVFLISASKDGKPMLRNGETGDWIGTFEGHKGAVWSACLNGPATHAATASADFSARVWNAVSGDEIMQFSHKHIVRTCSFSKDSVRLLTGGQEKLIRVFDLMQPDADPLVMEGATGSVRNAHFLANDSLVVAACNDSNGIRVWDVRQLKLVRTIETSAPVTDIELSVDGRHLTTSCGKEVQMWDAASFAPVRTYTLSFPVETAATCPQRGRFAACGPDMWPRLFDMGSGDELECNKGHHGPVHSIRFHPNGESYASGSEDGTIRIWSTTTASESLAVGSGPADAEA